MKDKPKEYSLPDLSQKPVPNNGKGDALEQAPLENQTKSDKPKSPAEAFNLMTETLTELNANIQVSILKTDQIYNFVHSVVEQNKISGDLLVQKGQDEILNVLFRTYNNIFRTSELPKTPTKSVKLLNKILQSIESDFEVLDIHVIKPKINFLIDYSTMKVVGTSTMGALGFLNTENSVQKVEAMGFIVKNTIRDKAEVIIYKKD